jgi:hypothetical protein
MIDTQEKLDAFVKAHRIRMIAEAMVAFARYAEGDDNDVWNAFMASDLEQCDYNIHRPEDSNLIRIVAYALKHVPNEAPHVLQVNTRIECHVADITWEA